MTDPFIDMGPGTPPIDIQAWDERRSELESGIDPRTGRPYRRGGPAVVSFPPEIYPTRDAQTFNITGTGTLGPGPVVATVVAGPFQVPVNMVAVVREVTLVVNNLLTTSLITFSLRFNQGPVPGFDNMFVPPRAAASVSISYPPQSTLVRVPDGSSIDIAVVIADAGAYQLTANFRGWWYPKDTVVGW